MQVGRDEELLVQPVDDRVRAGRAHDQLGRLGPLSRGEPGEVSDQPVLTPGRERAVGGDEAAALPDPVGQRLLLLRAERPLVGGREDDLVAAEVGQSGGIGDDVHLEPSSPVEEPQQRLGGSGVVAVAAAAGQVGEDGDHESDPNHHAYHAIPAMVSNTA